MAEGFIHTLFKGERWINEVEDGAAFGGAHATKEAPNQQDVHAQRRQDRARHPQPRRHDQRAQFVWQGPGE